MPGPYIQNPTPDWLKPENASVTDTALTKAMRMIGHLIGADNPTAQVLGLMMTDVPGGSATGGLAKAVEGLKARVIKAYHGSPHDFERFSLEKIGTGEGAQAYAHGLYFAENPKVGKGYQEALSGTVPTRVVVDGKELSFPEAVEKAFGKTTADAVMNIQGIQNNADAWNGVASKLNQMGHSAELGSGRLYEVDIHADPSQFLDWDAPLSHQSETVKKQLADARLVHPDTHANLSGEQIVNMTSAQTGMMGSDANRRASEMLHEAGIPGVKYFDQGSRASAGGELIGVEQTPEGWRSKIRVQDRSVGFQNAPTTAWTVSMPFKTEGEARAWANEKINSGTRNYVVFDDRLIDILKKYGLLLPAAGGAGQATIQRRMGPERP